MGLLPLRPSLQVPPTYTRASRSTSVSFCGNSLMHLGDYSRALSFLNRAIKLDPKNAQVNMYVCTYARTFTHFGICTKYTWAYMLIYTHMHTHIYVCTHTHTHICMHTHTRTHARTHTHTHTHTHYNDLLHTLHRHTTFEACANSRYKARSRPYRTSTDPWSWIPRSMRSVSSGPACSPSRGG